MVRYLLTPTKGIFKICKVHCFFDVAPLCQTAPLARFLKQPPHQTHSPHTTQTPILQPLVESPHCHSCRLVSAVTQQSEHHFHLISTLWQQALACVAKHKPPLAVWGWRGVDLRCPLGSHICDFAFHGFFSTYQPPCFLWDRKSALFPVTVFFHVVTSSCFARTTLCCWLRLEVVLLMVGAGTTRQDHTSK